MPFLQWLRVGIRPSRREARPVRSGPWNARVTGRDARGHFQQRAVGEADCPAGCFARSPRAEPVGELASLSSRVPVVEPDDG